MFTIVKQYPLIDQEMMAVAFLDLEVGEGTSVRAPMIVEALNLDHMWEQKGKEAFLTKPVIAGPFQHLITPFRSPLPEYRFMLQLRGAWVSVRNRNGVQPFLRGLHIQHQLSQDTGFDDIQSREYYGQLDRGPSEFPAIQQLYRDWGVSIVWWP